MNDLYTQEYCKIMKANYEHTSMSSNRIEEIKNFALGMKFSRIGIAHCITFSNETRLLKEYLSSYFEVFTVDCKYDRLSKQDIIGGTGHRVLCNPAGQADFLNKKNTDLNISMG